MCHWFPILFPISFRIFEVFGFVCTFCWKMKQQKCIEAFSIIITFERSVLMQFRCKTPHSRIIFCSELSEEVVPNVLNDEVKEWNRVKQRRGEPQQQGYVIKQFAQSFVLLFLALLVIISLIFQVNNYSFFSIIFGSDTPYREQRNKINFLYFFLEKTSIIFQKDSWSLYNPISTEMHLVNESNLSHGFPRESVKRFW